MGWQTVLNQLSVQNIAIVENLLLDLHPGMTALTGETGAGKSIIIDALDLALGGRASTGLIRHGAERAEISAVFNVQAIPEAKAWLVEHELDNDNEVILRRVIKHDGPSRHFINGQACTQAQLRHLGGMLLNIHGQHEHQSLLLQDKQRTILDRYGKHDALLQQIKQCHQQWAEKQHRLHTLIASPSEQQARLELLQYQVNELQHLAITATEVTECEQQHKQLAHADSLCDNVQTACNALDAETDVNAAQLIHQAEAAIKSIVKLAPNLQACVDLLASANIQVQEASAELNHYLNNIEVNPERLFALEQRLNQIHDTARKHHVEPEKLPEVQARLEQELEQLQNADQLRAQLQQDIAALETEYRAISAKLTLQRQKTAKKLNALVTDSMQTLGMVGGIFAIHLQAHHDISAHGAERITFQVTANPGQPLQALNKVASGGEMSRISLALQMITAQKEDTPTLIFDEVDVGIGGGTAEVVGKLLRQLGEKAQVLCITHLPQVAAQAHQHLQVQKQTQNKQTQTTIIALEKQPRIAEIARMLGGINITPQTLKHAKEMLGKS